MLGLNVYQWFLIIVSVLSAVAGATAQLTELFGAGPAQTIVTAATFANTIITAIMTPLVGNASMVKTVAALPGVSRVAVNEQASPAIAAVATDPAQPNVGPVTPEVRSTLQAIAKGAAVIMLALLIASPVLAQQQKKGLNIFQPRTDATDSVQSATEPGSKGLPDLLKMLDAKVLPDLKYAKALADGAHNDITSACYAAWITIIESRQSAVKDAQGNEIPEPDPHIITDFEKLVELRNALQPTSDFMVKCSPVAQMVKRDMLNWIGLIVGGGASLTALVPGL